jgi:hypothetical protein
MKYLPFLAAGLLWGAALFAESPRIYDVAPMAAAKTDAKAPLFDWSLLWSGSWEQSKTLHNRGEARLSFLPLGLVLRGEALDRRTMNFELDPPWVVDRDTAIKAIDIAYHLNHRKKGELLFDINTGTMTEGIGHYGYEQDRFGKNQIVSVSHNPYPCAFDHGIITAMAHKFQPAALIKHDDTKECRSNGAETCTYNITW